MFQLRIGSIKKNFRITFSFEKLTLGEKISGRREEFGDNMKLERRGDVIKSNKDEVREDKLHILSHYFGIV